MDEWHKYGGVIDRNKELTDSVDYNKENDTDKTYAQTGRCDETSPVRVI